MGTPINMSNTVDNLVKFVYINMTVTYGAGADPGKYLTVSKVQWSYVTFVTRALNARALQGVRKNIKI